MSLNYLKKIHAIMSMGHPLHEACRFLGVSEKNYHHWLKLEKNYQLQTAQNEIMWLKSAIAKQEMDKSL